MAFPTRIYLTGFMGSGKSTVGAALAATLGYAFVDLDQVIEDAAGYSIAGLFAVEGEAAFRRREARALRDTAEKEEVVVALGGGTLVDEANRAFALQHGTVVYLDVPVDRLVDRLLRGRARADRPLLLDDEGRPLEHGALRERVATMLKGRQPFYRQAHVVVPVGADRVAVTVDRVRRALGHAGTD